jgi:hypothetical protein
MSTTDEMRPSVEADRPSTIPRFQSIEEEAAFWDTHDSAEFENEFEDVEEEMRFVLVRPTERWLPLVLDDHLMAMLEERATQQGIAPAALVSRWIMERLDAS